MKEIPSAFVGHPSPQRGQRRVDGSSSRGRPARRAQPAPRRGVRQREGGVEDVFGQRGRQGGRRGVRVFAAQQVDGSPPTDQVSDVGGRLGTPRDGAAAQVGLEEQRESLLDGGDGVARGPFIAVQRSVEEAARTGRREDVRAGSPTVRWSP